MYGIVGLPNIDTLFVYVDVYVLLRILIVMYSICISFMVHTLYSVLE